MNTMLILHIQCMSIFKTCLCIFAQRHSEVNMVVICHLYLKHSYVAVERLEFALGSSRILMLQYSISKFHCIGFSFLSG